MKSKILVFIPTYRCESQIVRVFGQFNDQVQKWVDTVMVVDNQSPDRTMEIAIDFGRDQLKGCNFVAWSNDENYGLGGSHKVAFRYAIEQGFDYLVVLHGDDQADIRDLVSLFEIGAHSKVDCLLGARFMPKSCLDGYSRFRRLGNRVYNQLFSLVTLKKVYDLGSGLNVYKLSAYRDFFYKTFPDDLTFNYVMLLAAFHRRQSVRFFPITWREYDQISNVKIFYQAFKVLGYLGSYLIGRASFLKSERRLRSFDSYTGKIRYCRSSIEK
ncbi:MAG: glycosyltransferase family 2 protein [Bdellovibrionales bacterium]|nr:glycosyltransferase family 2 protein [Bdellovibrionales bacterium]